MNRRGFIGSILGVVAWSKSKLGVPLYPVIGNDGKLHGYSPAASAIQPTCEVYDAEYSFLGNWPVGDVDEMSSTLTVSGLLPSNAAYFVFPYGMTGRKPYDRKRL